MCSLGGALQNSSEGAGESGLALRVLASLPEDRSWVLSTTAHCLYLQFQGNGGPTPTLTFAYTPLPPPYTYR